MAEVAVIGAGVAGVTAAAALQAAGLRVRVLDRGHSPGGRCAAHGATAVDHGARFLTTEDEDFSAVLDAMAACGVTAPWSPRLVTIDADGQHVTQPRPPWQVGVPCMRAIVEHLAGPLAIDQRLEVGRLRMTELGWTLVDADGAPLGEYAAVLLAMPPAQALRLLPAGHVLREALRDRRAVPCQVAIAEFAEPLALEFDAAIVDDAVLAWAARETSKPGRAAGERWVLHGTAAWSAERLQAPAEAVARDLLARFDALTGGGLPAPVRAFGHRWSLALPVNPGGGAHWDEETLLGVAGDWCVSGDIEGAWRSGRALAGLVCRTLGGAAVVPLDASEQR